MAITISAIYRYPVKGLSAEKMDRVALTPGECLPQDRRFALAPGSTVFDPQHPQWLPKTHFIMLMRDEKLALLQTRFDSESGVLTIAENGRVLLDARMTEPEGRRLVAEFYTNFLGSAVKGPLRVVEAPGHAFADARRKPNATSDKYVSLINRASIAALEAAMEAPIDPIRFRANVYFDGAPAWCEHDWIGAEIALGAARCAWSRRSPDAQQPRSIPSPPNAISTSPPPSTAPSATSTWASTPKSWPAAKSPPATRSSPRQTAWMEQQWFLNPDLARYPTFSENPTSDLGDRDTYEHSEAVPAQGQWERMSGRNQPA